MNVVIWVAQALLAAGFVAAGFGHAFRFDRFAATPRMAWALAVGRRNLRLIGLLEIAGAIGLIVPAASGILPWLTPLAAVGLALIMVFAAVLHARRGETQAIVANAVLFAVAAFVFVGRAFIEPL